MSRSRARSRAPLSAATAAAGLLVLGHASARAQSESSSRFRFEGRVDVIRNAWRGVEGDQRTRVAIQGGVGGAMYVSRYVRVAALAGAGVADSRRDSGASARVDLAARFVLDPEFVNRWTPYAAGGLTGRYERPGDWRAHLHTALGMEGPRMGRVAPFVELGYGGGTRFAIGLRGAAGRLR